MTIRAERRVPIECGIARLLTDAEISAQLGEPLAVVREVRAYLDTLVLETDGDRETIFAARPVASFHGPADPAVIAELVDALYPPQTVAPCGTAAAFNRHCRRGEPIDEACRRAKAASRRNAA